jgi:hypothetical protein
VFQNWIERLKSVIIHNGESFIKWLIKVPLVPSSSRNRRGGHYFFHPLYIDTSHLCQEFEWTKIHCLRAYRICSIVCQAFYMNQRCCSIDNYWSDFCSPIVIMTSVMMFSLIMLFSTLQIDRFLTETLDVEISVIYVEERRRFHRLARFRRMPITAFFRLNRALSDWSSLWMYDCSQTNGNPIETIFASRLADQRGWLRCAQEISRMVIWRKIPSRLNIKTSKSVWSSSSTNAWMSFYGFPPRCNSSSCNRFSQSSITTSWPGSEDSDYPNEYIQFNTSIFPWFYIRMNKTERGPHSNIPSSNFKFI